ncbi:Cpap3-d2, partial [Cordylochernes scorpioides]
MKNKVYVVRKLYIEKNYTSGIIDVCVLIRPCDTGVVSQRDSVCKKESGLFPHEKYCDYYYECQDGVASVQQCPNGLAFSGRGRGLLLNCDYPHRVGCPDNDGRVMGRQMAVRSYVHLNTPSISSFQVWNGADCAEAPIGTDNCGWLYGVFPHQTSCTRYWQCWNGTATIQQCPFSLLYNDQLHSCDWPDNVPDCQKHQGLVKRTEFVCPALCKDTPNGHVPIENSCIRFWLCVGGYPRLQRCPAGLAFNPSTSRCELATNIPG